MGRGEKLGGRGGSPYRKSAIRERGRGREFSQKNLPPCCADSQEKITLFRRGNKQAKICLGQRKRKGKNPEVNRQNFASSSLSAS